MISWNKISDVAQLDAIAKRSKTVPCLILKHSTTCSISGMAKARLERNWDFESTEIEPYYLDLLSFRPISAAIAERFQVHHESPQVLLIHNGTCIYDASHLDISVEELHDIHATEVA
jgi:bacillithiol system protein YtxJ